ncbi:MAG TPA: hypothetical protein VFZ76_11945 [Anaerolineales bacterium]
MREWSLTHQDLPSLTLAADARLSVPDYFDDQIWELSLRGGDPPALALQTTYGLRARGFRLFPRFLENDLMRSDPDQFHSPPIMKHFFPNFSQIFFSPFEDIDVELEYWVPESHAIAGRLNIINCDAFTRTVNIELNALLAHIDGERMAPTEIQATTILSGKTADLCPVVFLTAGPLVASGPFPGLAITFEIPPGSQRKVTWVHAALHSTEDSFDLARQVAARNWDAERAKIEMMNASQIEIFTGDPAWDIALALSQKIAFGLFTGPTSEMKNPSFVINRLPDQGYSIRRDGSDYGTTWSGQSPLEAYYLSNLILPSTPELAADILHNFLSTQSEDGFIDWKPGLGGQRSNRLATPLLATMAWQIYTATHETKFVEKLFPALMKFFLAWFTPDHDRDMDAVPEWDDPMQSGFDDHPLFARWHSWAQGVDITTVESPSLCSFLYRESQALICMAELTGQYELLAQLKQFSENLRIAVETSWDPDNAWYCYRDRDTHFTTVAKPIASYDGTGVISINESFEWPVRLLFRVKTVGESTRRPKIFIHGVSASGSHKVERISLDRFQWYLDWGTATSEFTYASLEQLEIHGLEEHDSVVVQSVGLNFQDQTLLTPLWAGIASPEHAQSLVNTTVTSADVFWHAFGLPACPQSHDEALDSICQNVHSSWNTLIAEGLVAYGYQAEAAELLSRMMKAITLSLREEGSFYRYYNANSGRGSGERDALGGLAPLGLFLKVLGVNLISPHKIELSGYNPFQWPVTVKYRGLTVLRQREKTQIIFSDGQTVEVSTPEPQFIALE